MPKRFSASSAAQLMTCPGSANLELAIPGYVEPVRDDMAGAKGVGTMLHAFMDTYFTGTDPDELREYAAIIQVFAETKVKERRELCDEPLKCVLWLSNQSQAEAEVIADMRDWLPLLRPYPPKMLRFLAETALYVADLQERFAGTATVYGERSMVATWLPSNPRTTPDIAIIGGKTLHIVDYKTGALFVDPCDNDQLLFYAACCLVDAPAAEEFTVHVLQPGNLSSWTAPVSYLREWMKKAVATDNKIQAKDLTLVPSDHCTFCPANPWGRGDKSEAKCPAMQEILYPPVVDNDELFADS